jgi:hypothetical protein
MFLAGSLGKAFDQPFKPLMSKNSKRELDMHTSLVKKCIVI